MTYWKLGFSILALLLFFPFSSTAQDRPFVEAVFDAPETGACEVLSPDPAYVEEMLIDIDSIGTETGETYQRRAALVLGNGAYTGIKPLKNPANDATSMTRVLRALGFTVYRGIDLNADALNDCLERYAADLEAKPADLSLFYYAGHGVQLTSEADTEKRNYMLATDAQISDSGQGVGFRQIDAVLSDMRGKRRLDPTFL